MTPVSGDTAFYIALANPRDELTSDHRVRQAGFVVLLGL